jgi:subtilisin family serine protease
MKKLTAVLAVIGTSMLLMAQSCEIDPCVIAPDLCTPAPPATAYDCSAPAALKGYIKVKNPVVGSYIVVMKKPGVNALEVQDIVAFSAKYAGVSLVKTLRSVNGFSAKMKGDVVVKLLRDPAVQYIQQNRKVKANDNPTWGIDRIDQRDLPLDWKFDPGANGSGVHFYGIDTGIDLANADFSGRTGESHSAVVGLPPDTDGHGHGTHTAGTVGGTKYGVAKAVTIHAVKVLDAQGSGSDTDVIAGIDWVTQHVKANGWRAVANMSLGGPAPAPALDQAVCNAIAAGVAFGIAAGNESSDACTSAPANVLQALTMGAVDKTDTGASFSNTGATCLDLWAPGVDVESDMPGGGGITMSGTSMAAPHATGVLALYLSVHPTATVAEANAAIIAGASKDKLSGVDGPNLLLYTVTKP